MQKTNCNFPFQVRKPFLPVFQKFVREIILLLYVDSFRKLPFPFLCPDVTRKQYKREIW